MALSFPVLPMKATMGSARAVPEGDDWAYEIKWDGYRTIAHITDGAVRLQSTAGHDVTDRWPEFDDLARSVNATSAILDGELVVFDDDGRPRFDLVQRSGVGSDRQAVIQFFDVLQIDGTDTIDLAYLDRRRLLDGVIESSDNWMVPSFHLGDGSALLEATVEQGLEGVIAKRVDSTYQPGTRTKGWRKIKNRRRATLTRGGYTTGTANRADTFGALLVGRRRADGGLDFAGGVGTGFDHRTLVSMTAKLDALRTDNCPFDPTPPPARNSAPLLRQVRSWLRISGSGRVAA